MVSTLDLIMLHRDVLKFCRGVLAGLAGLISAQAQLTVTGVSDKTVYTDTVTFTVPAQPGFTYSIHLNSNSVPDGVSTTVNQADYYELYIQRTETATATLSNRLVRFIVRASARGNTE